MKYQDFQNRIFDGITQAMNQRDLDNMPAELWMDDADIDETQARMLLDMIFTAKAIASGLDLVENFPNEYGNMNPLEAQYRFIADDCIGEDFNWDQAVDDTINSAMTYYCMDNWDLYYEIIQKLLQIIDLDWFNKDVYSKAVNYLYDGYACDFEEA